MFHFVSCLIVSQAHSVDEEDGLPLGVEASINLDAFDPEDLDDEELVEGEDGLAPASIVSSAFSARSVRYEESLKLY
jgi:hypothetical protein